MFGLLEWAWTQVNWRVKIRKLRRVMLRFVSPRKMYPDQCRFANFWLSWIRRKLQENLWGVTIWCDCHWSSLGSQWKQPFLRSKDKLWHNYRQVNLESWDQQLVRQRFHFHLGDQFKNSANFENAWRLGLWICWWNSVGKIDCEWMNS